MQFRNNRTGEIITTDLSKEQIVQQFAGSAADDHWLWFWLTQHVNKQKEGVSANTDMIAFLADSFLLALGMGLKSPMIRLHYQNRRYKIYLSKRGTLCFKTGSLEEGTHDPVGDEEYMGCLYSGKFLANRERTMPPENHDFLDCLSADPAGFFARVSKDMDRCCYCGKALEDQRSKDVGYGAVCASRWGLPWGKTYDEKVPSFAQLWAGATPEDKKSVRGICISIRQSPRDEFLWNLLGDALADAGYTKRPQMPSPNVIIPAP